MRMMLNRRDNGEDGKTENTQGRPDSSYSLQELLIFPQPMVEFGSMVLHSSKLSGGRRKKTASEMIKISIISTFSHRIFASYRG